MNSLDLAQWDWKAILIAALIGLAAGTIAKILMPGKDGVGIISTALLGITGSFVAKWVMQYYEVAMDAPLAHFAAQIAGAFALLVIFRLIKVII